MDEYETNNEQFEEFFVNYFVENYPAISRRLTWTGIQCHELSMDSGEACEWYRRRLGLDSNTNAEDGQEDT